MWMLNLAAGLQLGSGLAWMPRKNKTQLYDHIFKSSYVGEEVCMTVMRHVWKWGQWKSICFQSLPEKYTNAPTACKMRDVYLLWWGHLCSVSVIQTMAAFKRVTPKCTQLGILTHFFCNPHPNWMIGLRRLIGNLPYINDSFLPQRTHTLNINSKSTTWTQRYFTPLQQLLETWHTVYRGQSMSLTSSEAANTTICLATTACTSFLTRLPFGNTMIRSSFFIPTVLFCVALIFCPCFSSALNGFVSDCLISSSSSSASWSPSPLLSSSSSLFVQSLLFRLIVPWAEATVERWIL